MRLKLDVLVVGAGPGGSSASFFLKHFDKHNEFNVTLIDKFPEEKYGRYHRMCGEGVSQVAFKELYPIEPEGVIHKIKLTEEVYPHNITLKTAVPGYLLNRVAFLKSIQRKFINKGGLFENKMVLDFVNKENKVKVLFDSGTYGSFDYVIAADGANSFFRRKFGLKARGMCFAIQYIVDKIVEPSSIKFFYDEKYGGDYCWEFPNESTTKMGFPIIKGQPIFYPKGEKILAKHVRPIAFGGIDKYVLSNILLVGEAACQTNSLSKGGIRPAMVAGRSAALALINADPSSYEKNWLNTDYANPSFYFAYKQLAKMTNKQLSKMARNILDQKMSTLDAKLLGIFDLCNAVGW